MSVLRGDATLRKFDPVLQSSWGLELKSYDEYKD
jgi:hypothetical protein